MLLSMKTWILHLIDFVLHIDKHLNRLIDVSGIGAYLILFGIIFCETGLVVTPFLPGDSLLFAAGALSATGSLHLWILLPVFICAAILGDSMNYSIGMRLGQRVYREERLFGLPVKRQHLDEAKSFYVKYGVKAIALSRFLPILRTLVPFVAGVGAMPYKSFFSSNVIGGISWVSIFTLGGYFFGNIPSVKQNFGLVVIGIIGVSLIPVLIEVVRTFFQKPRPKF
jgi:membrane-associated protein